MVNIKDTDKVNPSINKSSANKTKKQQSIRVGDSIGRKRGKSIALAKEFNSANVTANVKEISSSFTIIKKPFQKIDLIPHQLTEPTDILKINKSNSTSVSEINGIGGTTYLKFQAVGIKTVEDFAKAGVTRISNILGWSEKGGLPFYLRGLSVYENRIIKIKHPKQISQNPIYLDIETDLFQRRVWMIGIYISRVNEFIQLVADKPQDEPQIIKHTLEILSDHPNEPVISYSGSRFDERILRKRFDEENLKHEHLIFDDILLDIKASLAFPIKAYTLGDLGEFYGYKFKHPNMDGQQVALLYSQYANDLKKFRGYEKLCDYNEDDVKSMAMLVEQIYLK